MAKKKIVKIVWRLYFRRFNQNEGFINQTMTPRIVVVVVRRLTNANGDSRSGNGKLFARF